MKLKLLLSAAFVAGAFSATAATASTPAPTNSANAMTALFGDPVIAKGTGFEIKRSDLDSVVTGAKAQAAAAQQMLPPDFEISMLNQLITIQLLLQKATSDDRAAGKIEADTQFTNLVERFGSMDDFRRQLKIVGMSEAELRNKAAQEATAKATLKRALKLNITEEQVKSYYSNHTQAFEEPEKVTAQHILLMTIDPATRLPLSTNAVAAKKKQMEELLARAKKGDDFGKLAKEFSEDPGSKENGGALPKFTREDMVSEFSTAAFGLKPGQISEIVSTMYGFHIIKLTEKFPAKKYGLLENIPQINRTPASLCRMELEGEQLRLQAPGYVKGLRTEAKVEVLDPQLKALESAIQDAEAKTPANP